MTHKALIKQLEDTCLGLDPIDPLRLLVDDVIEALAQSEQPAQQEPVADALHFAQWDAAKKDLSDYILVGSLTLAGIEDGEYGTSEIDPLDNTIDALQERIVTGSDHKKVPLLAYIGALKPTPPQRTWVDLTDTQIEQAYFEVVQEHRGAPMPWGQVQFGRALLDKFKEVNT